MHIHFYKYQGTANDFVVLDNRTNLYDNLTKKQIEFLCHRRLGIGADGLMLLNQQKGFDFAMKYYNSDGNESSMCGNGGRCITAFAHEIGVIKDTYSFIAIDGEHLAKKANDIVQLKMNDVKNITPIITGNELPDFEINTGSPHYVRFVENIDNIDVKTDGAKICYSFKEGINVNFVEIKDSTTLLVRTYERGVFDETWSCGTGSVAAALVYSVTFKYIHNPLSSTIPQYVKNPIHIITKGGDLQVSFDKKQYNPPSDSGFLEVSFCNIWLAGKAQKVYEGDIEI